MLGSPGVVLADVVCICACGAGAQGSAWSPTAAQQLPQQSQQGYSPSHATDPAAAGYAGQGYSYTGAGQPGADPANQQVDQADRCIVSNSSQIIFGVARLWANHVYFFVCGQDH